MEAAQQGSKPVYVFVLVGAITGAPVFTGWFWSRADARDYARDMRYTGTRVRRAKLTVFNK